jgi:hypothetical protein
VEPPDSEVRHSPLPTQKARPSQPSEDRPHYPSVDRGLDRILARSPAPLVVVLGAKARDHTSALWQLPDGFGTTDTVGRNERANMAIRALGGHHRLITYLWHPTGMTAPKDFPRSYPNHLSTLRELVAGRLTVEDFAHENPDLTDPSRS